jgi:integrase/recombinase XerC/integrase/recombinase XerD
MWLDDQESEATFETYEVSVRQFFRFVLESRGVVLERGKMALDEVTVRDVKPWLIGGMQVSKWKQHLSDERGLADATVNLRLSALSSFYGFCVDRYTVSDPRTGREVSLAQSNPVTRVERFDVEPYERSTYLSPVQIRALLSAIPRDSVTGLRNYALVSAYIYTGARNSEVRLMRWGDIRKEGGRIWYRTKRKGKSGKGERHDLEMPLPAYQAICEYLEAAGRRETIQPEDYIFVPHSDSAARFDNVEAVAVGEKPLSSSWVNRMIRAAAKRAGVQWEQVTTHTLRHSAAMLMRKAGGDVQEVQQFLGHKSIQTTQIYLQHTEKKKNVHWAQMEALIWGK